MLSGFRWRGGVHPREVSAGRTPDALPAVAPVDSSLRSSPGCSIPQHIRGSAPQLHRRTRRARSRACSDRQPLRRVSLGGDDRSRSCRGALGGLGHRRRLDLSRPQRRDQGIRPFWLEVLQQRAALAARRGRRLVAEEVLRHAEVARVPVERLGSGLPEPASSIPVRARLRRHAGAATRGPHSDLRGSALYRGTPRGTRAGPSGWGIISCLRLLVYSLTKTEENDRPGDRFTVFPRREGC